VTGVGAGEPRGINGGYGNYLPRRIKERQGFLEHSSKEEKGNPGHELVEGRIVGNLLQLEQVPDRTQQFNEIHRVPIVGTQSLPQEEDRHELMLSIRFPGVFAGIER